MTGNQLYCHFTQENLLKMNGKKVDYLSSLSIPLFQNTPHGIACIAIQTAKRGVAWCPKHPAPFITYSSSSSLIML
jgi:hypothetical protein